MNCDQSVERSALQVGSEEESIARHYAALHRMASRKLRSEALSFQWSPPALINEAYLRIATQKGKDWVDHPNVLALWSRAMGNVLIDNGRAYRSQKRNIGQEVDLADTVLLAPGGLTGRTLAIRFALRRLESGNRRQGQILRLHFVAGLSVQSTARMLRVSSRTVIREAEKVRDKLRNELSAGDCRDIL